MKKVIGWIRNNEFLVMLVLIGSILRIPSIFEPGWYGDEGIYLVLGSGLRKGLLFYKEIHDNKPPLLYFLAAMTNSVAYFRALLLVWMGVTLVVFDGLVKKIINKKRWQRISLVCFLIFATLPTIEGNIANAEIFMILPTILGVDLLVGQHNNKKKSNWKYALAGVLFSLAFLFKVPALFEFLGLGFFFVVMNNKNLKKIILSLKKAHWWLFLVGFLAPIVISLLYYWVMGAGQDYLVAGFLQNVGYLSSWRTGSITKSGVSTQSGLAIRGLILLLLVLVFWIMGKKVNWKYKMVWVWFGFALFGALLSERPYPHYLIQVVASGSLLLGLTIEKIKRIWWTCLIFGIMIFSIFKYNFYFYPTVSYYDKFVKMISGQTSYEEYADSFDWRVKRTRELTAYLRTVTEPGEKIFVWGDEPFVYFESDTLPVGKYTVAYHIIDFEAIEQTTELLLNEKPRIIVKMEGEKRPFDELRGVLADNYALVKIVNDAYIYLRHTK
jgi:hypothetical protein